MKITLNASIKEHREIAELFRGCDNEGWIFVGACVNLFWLTNSSEYEDSFVHHEDIKEDKITIDLDTAQMDLRMALGTRIEFEGVYVGGVDYFGEDTSYRTTGAINQVFDGIYTIEGCEFDASMLKLCPDYLKSVGVEVE